MNLETFVTSDLLAMTRGEFDMTPKEVYDAALSILDSILNVDSYMP